MKNIILRPAQPGNDFKQLAIWFSILEDETNTESGLKEYFEKNKKNIFHMIAEDNHGELIGFYWALRSHLQESLATFFLFVKPEERGHGVGNFLYGNLEMAMALANIKRLRVNIWDNSPRDRAFAERRGFTERSHAMKMELNLDTFNDRAYDAIIDKLQSEGFKFTSMAELGNTEDAQRKLYLLNETTGMETLGSDGSASWASFEDFQQSVCNADWYRPDGQMVVIYTNTGDWAAMSAISRFDDYAYNLHTGVDKRYRGRKLAQAVKVMALRYARDILKVHKVHTHHNTKNLPMIVIDLKFGYVQLPGTFLMEKTL